MFESTVGCLVNQKSKGGVLSYFGLSIQNRKVVVKTSLDAWTGFWLKKVKQWLTW